MCIRNGLIGKGVAGASWFVSEKTLNPTVRGMRTVNDPYVAIRYDGGVDIMLLKFEY